MTASLRLALALAIPLGFATPAHADGARSDAELAAINPCDASHAKDARLTAVCQHMLYIDKGPASCAELKRACESAGFFFGGYVDKKGLQFDCLAPLLLGKSVAGVTVSHGAPASCLAAKIDGPVTNPPPAPQPGCEAVQKACLAAGFYSGGFVEKKGLLDDCQTPLIHGISVPGVTVNASAIAACARAVNALQAPKPDPAEVASRDPCDPSHAGDAKMAAVCERVLHIDSGPAECLELERNCEAAGFHFGGYVERKGLQLDCLTPLLLGKTVEGVKVSSATAAACLAAAPPRK